MKSVILFFLITIFIFTVTSRANFYEEEIFKFQPLNKGEYLIYIKKRMFKLFIIDPKGRKVESFDIALGRKPYFENKYYEGDNGTPEGIYYVNAILSLDAPTNSLSYKKLKKMNSIYLKASEGHFLWNNPDKDLGTNSYGPRFYRINYPNKFDIIRYNEMLKKDIIPKNRDGSYKKIGTGIAIHGTNDPYSIGHLITTGCIRLRNEDLIKLDKYVKIGTPVIIEK